MSDIRCSKSNSPQFLYLLSVLMVSVCLVLIGCGKSDSENTTSKGEAPLLVVEVVQAVQKDIPVVREWIGTLDGVVNVSILAQVSGYLIKQNYREGQPVKKGALLYEIDPRVYLAALDQAKSNLARQQAILKAAQLDLARVQRLLPEKAVSVRERDNAIGKADTAKADVLAAEAAVKKAKLDLGFTRIHSPINGIPGITKAQLGDLVGPGSANALLTTVSQVNPIKAVIPISEQDYLYFERTKSENNRASSVHPSLFLADGTEYPYLGDHQASDRQVDVKSGTIQVSIYYPNPNNLLRPGQYARIRAETDTYSNATVVPQRAVIDLQGQALLAIVKPDNTISMRKVELGERQDDWQIVEKGLQPDERVVISGLQKIRDGMKVDPKVKDQKTISPVSPDVIGE
jgi:membrane fusion protein (multidrug efflux system)